jgi:sarcosine oxidase subunit beta
MIQVVIIGAGVVGCSIAFALAKRGVNTLNIDQLPAAGYGSTSHSSAIVRPIYSHITAVALAHECRHYWQQWPEFIGPDAPAGYARYHECGGIVLMKRGEEASFDKNIAALETVGVEFDILSSEQIKALYPGIDLRGYGPAKLLDDPDFGTPTEGEIGSALVVDAAGYVSDPQLAAQNLQFAAGQLGAEFLYNESVTAIYPGECVHLSGGKIITADLVVNAAGPHSGRINQLAGVEVPIKTRPLKHEVAYVNASNQHFTKTGKFLADMDAGIYQRHDGDDLVIGSADPDCDPDHEIDPDDRAQTFTTQWTTQVMRAAQRFPELAIPNTARGTVGIYDVSEDWIPIYDRTDQENYYVAIGTSGNQFKNAPLIGEIMANVIETGQLHDQTPAQLHLKHIDQTINLDFYSRNRVVQSTSGVLA